MLTRTRAALVAACAALAFAGAQAQSTPGADPALFEALGAQPGIDRIVDDFVPRLVADPRIGSFFAKTDLAHLKAMLAQQFCAVSGGPCVYAGVPMKLAHQDMDITRADFNALVEALQAAMEAQHVPFRTQNQLLARLAPMHRDIVNVH